VLLCAGLVLGFFCIFGPLVYVVKNNKMVISFGSGYKFLNGYLKLDQVYVFKIYTCQVLIRI
jgi:hypothetical protein